MRMDICRSTHLARLFPDLSISQIVIHFVMSLVFISVLLPIITQIVVALTVPPISVISAIVVNPLLSVLPGSQFPAFFASFIMACGAISMFVIFSEGLFSPTPCAFSKRGLSHHRSCHIPPIALAVVRNHL